MRLLIGSGCGVPRTLLEQLRERAGDLADVEIVHLRTEGGAFYTAQEYLSHFRHNALGIGPNTREAVNAGHADYTPLPLGEIPTLLRAKAFHIDLALLQVSPPDVRGFCSLGISVDILSAVVDCADVVVAEINKRMPRTMGQGDIPLSKFAESVETDIPLVEYTDPPVTATSLQIAKFISDLIGDGATLEIPLGSIGRALWQALQTINDLGIHTDILSSGCMELILRGNITGRRKGFSPGKIVLSSAYGDAEFYKFLDHHPAFEFQGVERVCDEKMIEANAAMTAIQCPDAVDLTGQAFARDGGEAFLRGSERSFLRAAVRSRGGKAVLALPSRTAGGVSNIVVSTPERCAYFTSRYDVEYIATEWGIERLHGRSLRERAVAMIQLAHPEDRDQLLEEARRRGLVHPEQIKLPQGLRPYPRELEREFDFGKGLKVFFRPIKPTDEDLLRELFYSHSEETILQRYFTIFRQLPHQQLQRFVTLDYHEQMAIVGIIPWEGRERLICVARYSREAEGYAEAAFTVHDDFQGRGIGTFLVRYLAEVARQHGILGFKATVLSTNAAMQHAFRKIAPKASIQTEDGVSSVRFDFAEIKNPSASRSKSTARRKPAPKAK